MRPIAAAATFVTASAIARRGDGQRRPLAHRHGLAAPAAKPAQCDGNVRDRHLPGPDHLVARHQATHRAVADGHQERLAADGRETQHPVQ
jgi:hypothetical protein